MKSRILETVFMNFFGGMFGVVGGYLFRSQGITIQVLVGGTAAVIGEVIGLLLYESYRDKKISSSLKVTNVLNKVTFNMLLFVVFLISYFVDYYPLISVTNVGELLLQIFAFIWIGIFYIIILSVTFDELIETGSFWGWLFFISCLGYLLFSPDIWEQNDESFFTKILISLTTTSIIYKLFIPRFIKKGKAN